MDRQALCPAVRDRLERLPPPYASHFGVVPLPPPETGVPLGTAVASHARATEALARVTLLAREFDDPYVVSRLLTRNEAVSSSAIEGTNSTLDELLSVEEDAAEAARDQALQVRDYARILDRFLPEAVKQGPGIFTPDFVRALHAEAMKSDPDYRDVPGNLRERVVWIGGLRDIAYSTYNPAPPAAVPRCLDDTIDYMRGDGLQAMTQSPIARMAIAHAHFEAVHPFMDGNGRVGRLLLPLMMAADGQVPLYLSPYIEANKTAYYAALKAAQQQLDWASAIGFFAEAITGTVDELMVTRAALTTLSEDWRQRRRYRRDSAAWRLLAILPSYPVVTAKRLTERLAVSAPAALSAIDQLVAAGILQERTGFRRNRVFVATEVLAIVNRPFGDAPILRG